MRCSAILLLFLLGACTQESARESPGLQAAASSSPAASASSEAPLIDLLRTSRRIPSSSQWFEIIALPNDVYALWEPGHEERVNSFLIAGRDQDVLYDTGMGIGDIGQAVAELRRVESLDDKPLMVVNSHNHLDHNAGNGAFAPVWIFEDEWAISKLTNGVSEGFAGYWSALRVHPGIVTPPEFDPQSFNIPPYPQENIRYLEDGDVIDLGNRALHVVHTTAHSPDGIALYDKDQQIFFGGDTFLGSSYLIRDLATLAQDLARVSSLPIRWHYSSHGPQLIEVMQEGQHLRIVRRMLDGEGNRSTTEFAGFEFPLLTLDNVAITLAGDFLTY